MCARGSQRASRKQWVCIPTPAFSATLCVVCRHSSSPHAMESNLDRLSSVRRSIDVAVTLQNRTCTSILLSGNLCQNTRSTGHAAAGLMEEFRRDAGIKDALARKFGVDSEECWLLSRGVGPIIQNSSMKPDDWHADQCCPKDVGKIGREKGLTLLAYPHDRWDLKWRSHLELMGSDEEIAARLATIPNRSIIIDGCVFHRATNPTQERWGGKRESADQHACTPSRRRRIHAHSHANTRSRATMNTH